MLGRIKIFQMLFEKITGCLQSFLVATKKRILNQDSACSEKAKAPSCSGRGGACGVLAVPGGREVMENRAAAGVKAAEPLLISHLLLPSVTPSCTQPITRLHTLAHQHQLFFFDPPDSTGVSVLMQPQNSTSIETFSNAENRDGELVFQQREPYILGEGKKKNQIRHMQTA